MSSKALKLSIAAALFASCTAAPHAAELFVQAPIGGIDGIQADGSTGAWPQSFSVAAGATLKSIDWYGYHLPGGLGPAADAFTVLVNSIDVTATAASLSSQAVLQVDSFVLYKYSLDVVDVPIVSGTLELMNGPDTQWAWQYSDPALYRTAYTLKGSIVPEPSIAALMFAGLAWLGVLARRRPRGT